MKFQEAVDGCINEALDDLAVLATYWERNRAKQRTPVVIRRALLDLCAEIAAGLPDNGPSAHE